LRKGPIRLIIFPYKVQLRSIRTHLLLSSPLSRDISRARAQVLEAIRNCRAFVSHFRWGDARGFRFYVDSGDRHYQMGEKVPFGDGLKMVMRAPFEAHVKIIKDGQIYDNLFRAGFELPIKSPGLYRLELYRNEKGWIYSNHLRIVSQP
jgi:hypothetical protein